MVTGTPPDERWNEAAETKPLGGGDCMPADDRSVSRTGKIGTPGTADCPKGEGHANIASIRTLQ
jgi:hypothetical protein